MTTLPGGQRQWEVTKPTAFTGCGCKANRAVGSQL